MRPAPESDGRHRSLPSFRATAFFLLWLVLVCSSLRPESAAAAASQPASLISPISQTTVRYGVLASFPPYQVWPQPGGAPGGADIELVREWVHAAGHKLVTVRYADLATLEADLGAGRIDLASSMARTRERENTLNFSRSYTQFALALVTRRDQPSGALLPDLAGRSIALVRGFASEAQADRLFPLASRVVVSTVREGLEAVRSGRADTFLEAMPVITELMAREQIRGLEIVRRLEAPTGQLHLALAPGLAALAGQLSAEIAATEPTRIASLVEAWSARHLPKPAGPFKLTADERERLARWPAPVIGIVGGESPFAATQPDAQPVGLSVDMLRAVLARLEVQPGRWRVLAAADVSQALQDGQVDLLIGLDEAADRSASVRFVGPFIEYPTVLIGRAEGAAFDLEQLYGRRLALPPDSAARALVEARYPSLTIVDCPTIENCVARVAAGEAEATLTDVVSAAFAMARRPHSDLQMIGTEPLLRRAHSIAVAVRHAELVPVFKRALDDTTAAELPALKDRWLSRPVRSDALRAKAQSLAPWGGLLLLLLLLMVGAHWNRLRREIERTRSAQLQAERAEAASRRLLTFLAHEVRNSLHSIITGAELAASPAPASQPLVRTLGASARATLLLLNNLLDRERLDLGRLMLRLHAARPVALVDAVVQEMWPAAEHRGLRLVFQPASADPLLQIDALRLQQVLRNMLSNAIKYSDQGCIEVSLDIKSADPPSAAGRCVLLRVVDEGRGHAEAGAARPNAAAGAAAATAAGDGGEAASSSGLGLPLCHDLARLMGGEFSLQPHAGGGSEARLVFKAEASAGAAGLGSAQPASLQVLVVEDAEVYGLLLQRAFTIEGHQTRLAGSLEQARAMLLEGPVDLLLTDLNLGDGSALDLLDFVAAQGLAPTLCTVLMTAELDDLPAQELLPHPVAAVLAKSGDARQLVASALQAARQR